MEPQVFEAFEEGSDGNSGGGEVSVTSVGGASSDPFDNIADNSGPIETDTSVSNTESWVDQQLAETPLTRDDVELFVRAAGAAATLAALYVAYEGGK